MGSTSRDRSQPTDAEGFVDKAVARLLVQEMLQTLSPRQREALILHYGEDLSRTTVAELMTLTTPKSVKTHLRRARTVLARTPDPVGGE
jgi:RNA polymerase sigma factor (sigma-70 family)